MNARRFTVAGVGPLPPGFRTMFTSHLIGVGDVTLHAVVGGSGPPLLLLPGWPQFWFGWRLAMPALARHFTVVAADLRGQGASDKPPEGYDPGALADEMAELMAALGHERFAVAGFDLGMLVGFHLAGRHPDRVDRAVLVEAVLPGSDLGPYLAEPARNELLWHFAFNRLETVNDRMVAGREEVYFGHQFTSKAGRSDAIPVAAVELYVDALRDPAARHASFKYYRRGTGPRRPDMRLTMPVLAVGAELSVGSMVAGILREYADDVDELVIPGVGHFVPEEAPDVLVAAVVDFLTSG